MDKRPSQHYRDRSSVVVVEETRGKPLQIISLLLGAQWVAVGVRNLVSCSTPLSGSDQEAFMMKQMYGEDCPSNKYKQFVADLVGIFALMQAGIRFHMATTTHVADLYITLVLLTMVDVLILFAMLRLGFDQNPVFYLVMAGGSALYEAYTLTLARKAHLARLKMKKFTVKD